MGHRQWATICKDTVQNNLINNNNMF
jgi:hypothetical protein